MQWGWQAGSGVSLLWGKVLEAQVPEYVFLGGHREMHLLQQEWGGVMTWELPPPHSAGFLQKGVGRGREGQQEPSRSLPRPSHPPSHPATHLLGVKQPMAVQPQPSLLPAEVAQLPLEMLGRAGLWQGRLPPPQPQALPPAARAYLRASPAKQGEGELADGDSHQVHPHGPPGGAGALGAPHLSAWGLWQEENAETPLKVIHGAALSGPVGGVFRAAEVVLVVQDKALRADQAWQATAGQGPGSRRSSWQWSGSGSRSPHLLLQAAHHAGQQPCLLALLGVADEQVHVVALQLPPEGAPSDSVGHTGVWLLCAPRSCPRGTAQLRGPARVPSLEG